MRPPAASRSRSTGSSWWVPRTASTGWLPYAAPSRRGRRSSSEAAMSSVRLDAVTKDYTLGQVTVPALRGVSLAVEPGEFMAVAGPSGSGKSTLLNLIGCLDHPTSGTVKIADRDVSALGDDDLSDLRARTIGFIFQTFNLIPVLSALENVEFPLLLRKGA